MFSAFLLLAQIQEQTDKTTPNAHPWWFNLFLFVPMILLFYMLIIAPARRESKQRALLLSALKKNDEVLTSAGIFGVVSHIKEPGDEVVLKLEDNARIRVLKSSIVRILSNKDTPSS